MVITADLGGAAWTPDEGNIWFTLPGGERLLGRRLRQPQNRMAGRYQWANPEDQLPGSGRISWNAEPVRRSQGMLKRV